MRARPFALPALAALLAAAGCGDATGPGRVERTIEVFGDPPRFGPPGTPLAAPFRVRVTERSSGKPVRGVTVTWRVVQGPGATVMPPSTITDSAGLAASRLTLGPDTGLYRVEAALGAGEGRVTFEARAVLAPEILSIAPSPAAAGSTVRITARNLSPVPGDHAVLFGGIRGAVTGGSATELDVVVPRCVPTRTVTVTIELGPVRSNGAPLEVQGDGAGPLTLAPGQALTLADPAALACVRLPGGESGAAYLVVSQNVDEVADRNLPFQLVGLSGLATQPALAAAPAALLSGDPLASTGFGAPAARWELRLRTLERELPADRALPPAGEAGPLGAAAECAQPTVGTRCTFKVINKDEKFVTVTAEAKHISRRAILFQDLNAPAGGFGPADFESFGRVFDDPIYDAITATFGSPSDVDGNGRVIILFTPVVNQMTAKGSTGFIAGFFYGLDLTTQENSNRAEIFYSLVPDPAGRFGDARATADVLRVVPPVLAHELQHMIHFNQRVLLRRASGQEVLWLSEALAHAAEDIVADAFRARGDAAQADNFRLANLARAVRYLRDPSAASLVGTRPPGSLEERGAQWLFIKYLAGQYGGNDLLRRLTQTTRTGVANVTAETGQSWPTLVSDWTVALWADGAPELEGISVDRRYTYPNLDLREDLARLGTGYPLRVVPAGFQDFAVRDTLPGASPLHLLVRAGGTNPPPLHLSLAGAEGAPFSATARPQAVILRVR